LNFKHLEGDLTTSPDTNFRYFFFLKIIKIDGLKALHVSRFVKPAVFK
jgi:hypothetical protein